MTKLFIHSTEPELAARMRPEVYEKILKRRQALKEVFGEKLSNVTQFTLEIGCGHGHFLTAYGQDHPKELCIGIDVNKGRIYKALRKSGRTNLGNVLFFECDSMEFLNLLPTHVRLSKTWILYPDPWPKKRHFKNRIVQGPFLQKLASSTIPAGRLYIRSDYEPYLDWSKELLNDSLNWQCQENYAWPEIATTVFQELTNNQHYSLVAELKPREQRH